MNEIVTKGEAGKKDKEDEEKEGGFHARRRRNSRDNSIEVARRIELPGAA